MQSSMIGSILNILLALGSCFITSGVRHAESRFNETVASSMSSLMAVATTSLIIPATLYASIERGDVDSHNNIMVLSDGTAIIMLITYCIYLLFELESQSYLFDTGLQQEMEDDGAELQNLEPVRDTVYIVAVIILITVCQIFG